MMSVSACGDMSTMLPLLMISGTGGIGGGFMSNPAILMMLMGHDKKAMTLLPQLMIKTDDMYNKDRFASSCYDEWWYWR